MLQTALPTNGGSFGGRVGSSSGLKHSVSSTRARSPGEVRRYLLGPDGKEMDIRRHREAYSFAEYWDEFYAG